MAEDKHYDEVIKYYKNCKGYCPGPGLSEALSVNFCAGVAEPLVKDAVFQFNDQNGQNGEATGIWTTIVRVSDQIYDIIVYLGHGWQDKTKQGYYGHDVWIFRMSSLWAI